MHMLRLTLYLPIINEAKQDLRLEYITYMNKGIFEKDRSRRYKRHEYVIVRYRLAMIVIVLDEMYTYWSRCDCLTMMKIEI